MLNETCEIIMVAPQKYDAVKLLVTHEPLSFVLLFIIPLLAVLIVGLCMKVVNGAKFWATFAVLLFGEIIAMLIFLYTLTI
jgi:hypothetical protein